MNNETSALPPDLERALRQMAGYIAGLLPADNEPLGYLVLEMTEKIYSDALAARSN